MKCPYCGGEMELGYLKSSHRITWGKEDTLGWHPEDVTLAKLSLQALMEGFFAEAYCCSSCKKLIVSLE